MYCFHCGTEIPEDSNFCLVCGQDLRAVKARLMSDDNETVGKCEPSFIMKKDDYFSLTNRRATVVTGRVLFGSIKIKDKIELVTVDGISICKTMVTGLEEYQKLVDVAVAGQSIGLLTPLSGELFENCYGIIACKCGRPKHFLG